MREGGRGREGGRERGREEGRGGRGGRDDGAVQTGLYIVLNVWPNTLYLVLSSTKIFVVTH